MGETCYIDPDSRVHKQRLSLSERAITVINNDAIEFSDDPVEQNQTHFLNRLILNMYPVAESTIADAVAKRRSEICNLLKTNDQDPAVDKMVRLYTNELMENANERAALDKDEPISFSFNKELIQLLVNHVLDDTLVLSCYESLNRYLKALLEEYASLERHKRELIYFSDLVKEINVAIGDPTHDRKPQKLKVILKPRTSRDGVVSQKIYSFLPYAIVPDKGGNFNYLVGYAQERISPTVSLEKQETTIRLSNIESARVTAEYSFISKDDAKQLKSDISKHGGALKVGQVETVTVKFTERGLDQFHRIIHLRPNSYRQTDDKLIYEFNCTSFEARAYFFQFGPEIEILSPAPLRDSFAREYKKANAIYEKTEEKPKE